MLTLGTKAETLKKIYGRLSCACVLDQDSFTAGEWQKDMNAIWDRVRMHFPTESTKQGVIVRSSALNEDTSSESQAGKFESVENVIGKENFIQAVNRVIASFDDDNEDNQVLVQPVLKNVKYCGVAFTLDPNTLGNYYVINYDDTGSTSSVTSGNGEDSRLIYIFKGIQENEKNGFVYRLCTALRELEQLFDKDNLDVEFAVTEDGELYIFQVRALCINGNPVEYAKQKRELEHIERRIKREQKKKPFLCGNKTIYGVMPDWNPAEMIGIRPKPLAMSLYQEIITDNIWAYQRDNYGYRNLRSFPLMVDFCGLPYIDVRVSFNSFIPAELDENISEKLVNYYIDRLIEDPSKHDKVEFDIVFSCYTLDLPQRIQILKKYGFTEEETEKIVNALRNLTNQIIHHETGLWRKDYTKIEILEKRCEKILSSDLEETEKIYWLLEDCKRYGTLPFAGLARAAFIAVQMLRSMVSQGIISEEDYQLFMNDVNTVSSNMNKDFVRLSRQGFLEKYGHLRPGTYDITSQRYDEAPDLYFNWPVKEENDNVEDGKAGFRLSLNQMHKLADDLGRNGLNDNILELMDFIKSVIEGREYGKFIFTKNLSKALQLTGELGEKYGISREECSYVNIQAIRELYASTRDAEAALRESVSRGKERYQMTKGLILPPLLRSPSEVWYFNYPETEPNYITLSTAKGEVAVLEGDLEEKGIENKILLIPSADPGYDWIFAHGIQGFITKYGGANSHMAIRAGELGIPAVVGAGAKRFEQYKKANIIEIDALAKKVTILK